MANRVECFTASCRKCSECTGIVKDKKGNELFSCTPCGEKHEEIDARKCRFFCCNDANKGILCECCKRKAKGK